MKNKILLNWEREIINLTKYFIRKYFGEISDCDWYFISDEIGGILCVNDYFFSLDDMLGFLRYKTTKKQLFGFYDYQLKCDTNKVEPSTNFRNFVKYGLELKF